MIQNREHRGRESLIGKKNSLAMMTNHGGSLTNNAIIIMVARVSRAYEEALLMLPSPSLRPFRKKLKLKN